MNTQLPIKTRAGVKITKTSNAFAVQLCREQFTATINSLKLQMSSGLARQEHEHFNWDFKWHSYIVSYFSRVSKILLKKTKTKQTSLDRSESPAPAFKKGRKKKW